MMMDRFTVEEINLMCIYDTSDRDTLLGDLRAALPDIYEPEMLDIAASSIAKLGQMDDAEFGSIGFYPADDDMEEA